MPRSKVSNEVREEVVKRLFNNPNLSQTALAEEIGVSSKTLGGWFIKERNRRKNKGLPVPPDRRTRKGVKKYARKRAKKGAKNTVASHVVEAHITPQQDEPPMEMTLLSVPFASPHPPDAEDLLREENEKLKRRVSVLQRIIVELLDD